MFAVGDSDRGALRRGAGCNVDRMDRDERIWRIPGEGMKSGSEHRVPLSDAALELLTEAHKLRNGSDLVFPSPVKPRRPLSDMTLTKVLRDTGLAERATVHGFPSSFRDWCADTGQVRELAEAALAHTVGGVEGAYFRSDIFARRRRLMDRWGGYVTQADSKVVQLRCASEPVQQDVPEKRGTRDGGTFALRPSPLNNWGLEP